MLSGAAERLSELGREIDRRRIQIHLKKVEEDLRKKDKESLSIEKEQDRKMQLEHLREYRKNGEFPVNPDFYLRKPYFVGPEGTPCAVGHLMLEDDESRAVEDVAEENNHVLLEDVEEGAVAKWIEGSGLSKEECERIQPSYGGYTEVSLATSCGPLACRTALLSLSVLGAGSFLWLEKVSYRFLREAYPDKPLKRRTGLAGASALNLVSIVSLVVLLYAFLP